MTEHFVAELVKKYGREKGGTERPTGVAQLARSVGAIARREWAGERGEVVGAAVVLPVLLVHDTRLDSPGTCAILNDHLKSQIRTRPGDMRVAPLILLTVEDLENLESSVGRFSLAELLRDYHRSAGTAGFPSAFPGRLKMPRPHPAKRSSHVDVERAHGGGQPVPVPEAGGRRVFGAGPKRGGVEMIALPRLPTEAGPRRLQSDLSG